MDNTLNHKYITSFLQWSLEFRRKNGGREVVHLIVKTSRNCIACKDKSHPLYTFKQLFVTERIEVAQKAKLYYNCLRSRYGTPCKFSNCMLKTSMSFDDNQANKSASSNSTTTQSKWLLKLSDRNNATSLVMSTMSCFVPQLLTSINIYTGKKFVAIF